MERHDSRNDDAVERRLKARQGPDDAPEEQGSAAKAVQDDGADSGRDAEEEGSAGRPQR